MFDPNKISILSIRTLKATLDSSDLGLLNKPKSFSFAFSVNLMVDREKKLIRFVLEVIINQLSASTTQTERIAGSFTTEFIYQVENMEELITFKESENKADMEPGLSISIASIAYSTMRGIIHTRTQGTVLNGIILPIVDPLKLVQNEAQRELVER